MSKIRNVRDVIMSYFSLRASLQEPPSASGGQLRALRNQSVSDDSGGDWRRSQAADRTKALFADAALMLGSLSPLEQRVVCLRYWCVDEHETVERSVPTEDIAAVVLDVQAGNRGWEAVPLLMTAGGDVEVSRKVLDSDGEVVPGRSLVRGVRAKLTSFESIAEALRRERWPVPAGSTAEEWTERAARSVLQRALALVTDALSARSGISGASD